MNKNEILNKLLVLRRLFICMILIVQTQTKLNSKLVCFVFQNEIAYNYYSLNIIISVVILTAWRLNKVSKQAQIN